MLKRRVDNLNNMHVKSGFESHIRLDKTNDLLIWIWAFFPSLASFWG